MKLKKKYFVEIKDNKTNEFLFKKEFWTENEAIKYSLKTITDLLPCHFTAEVISSQTGEILFLISR